MVEYQDRVYKDIYDITYKYIPAEQKSDVLVVVFSALSEIPMYNMIGFMNSYNVNKLFILDDCGGHSKRGCYYLCEKLDFTISECIARLIDFIRIENGSSKIITTGTSKGGTAALYYAVKYHYYACIVHEPQIKILNFIKHKGLNDLLDVMVGDSGNKELLNTVIYQLFNTAERIPEIYLSTGKENYIYQEHIKGFLDFAKKNEYKINLFVSEINNHSLIQDYYYYYDSVINNLVKNVGRAILPRITKMSLEKNKMSLFVKCSEECSFSYLLMHKGKIVEEIDNVKTPECTFWANDAGMYSIMVEAFDSKRKTKLLYESFEIEAIDIANEDDSVVDEKIYTEEEYLYIRGYFIKRNDGYRPRAINKGWSEKNFGIDKQFTVYYDTKNEIAEYISKENSKIGCFLLGTALDTESGEDDINIIVKTLTEKLVISQEDFWDYVDILNGRHIIVYFKNGKGRLITDATGMRSTYYCLKEFAIASHYNLINDIIKCAKHPFFDEYFAYYKKNVACVSMPGNLTPYEDIKLLIPNHSLSLEDGFSINRFFPRKPLGETNISDVSDYIAGNIKRQYEQIVKKHDVIHSMTAGCDSRICLAAAKEVKDKVTLFTYHNEYFDANDAENVDREQNYKIAKKIAKKEGMNHLEIFFKGPYPKTMVEIMNKNHYHPHNKLVEEMRSKYNFTEKTLHLRSSIVESCRNTTHFLTPTMNNDLAFKFSIWTQYAESSIREKAQKYYKDFIEECDFQVYDKYGLGMDLAFYWESRLPAWMNASVLVDNDMLCDTYMLFNVRKIMALGMTLPTYWRNRNVIYKEIILRLWPSLLEYNMPNQSKNTYDLVDQEYTGCLNFRKVSINSGNLDKVKEIAMYTEIRDYGACIGFAESSVEKNDWVGIQFENKIEKDISYSYEFNIFTAWQDGTPYGEIKYQIVINNKVVYSSYCNEFNNRVNQIIYCFRADSTRSDKICIRLLGEKKTNGCNYNGMINIKSITLKREWMKKFEYESKILSTKEAYQKL